ncbi:MAG: hypothetical protein ABIS69_03160 [Sediminibacterium sp.]
MKKLLLTAMVMGAILFNNNETKAQVRIGVNINIGRPSWGLPGNYEGDYYYMPEIDTYYDIPHRQFIYFEGNDWVFASELPYAYRGYDLNRGYKVMVNEPRPYLHGNVYRTRYNNYYNNYQRQHVIAQRQGGYYNRYDNNRYDNNRYDNDRNNNGRDDRFEGRRDERYDRGRDNERNDRNDRGRGNEHGNGRDRNPLGRG